jgi:hypothetical protein
LIKRAGRYLIIYAIIAVVGLLTGCLQRFAPGRPEQSVVNSSTSTPPGLTVSVVQQVKPQSNLRLAYCRRFSASAFLDKGKTQVWLS